MTPDEAWEQIRIARAMAKPFCFALVSPQVLKVIEDEHEAQKQGETTDET